MFKINMEQIQHNIIESALKAPFSTHTHTHFLRAKHTKQNLTLKYTLKKITYFYMWFFHFVKKSLNIGGGLDE